MFTPYYRDLLNFCLRKTRNRETAADLAQESYARVLSMQQSGQTILYPGALLRQVALHVKIDLDRRAAVRQHDDIDSLSEAELLSIDQHRQPEQIYDATRTVQAYLDTIDALPSRCREAFYMYIFDELPNKEIAARLGVSLSMVNQYISRGKLACTALKRELDDDA